MYRYSGPARSMHRSAITEITPGGVNVAHFPVHVTSVYLLTHPQSTSDLPTLNKELHEGEKGRA